MSQDVGNSFKDSWLHNKFMNETWGEKLLPGVNAGVFFYPPKSVSA